MKSSKARAPADELRRLLSVAKREKWERLFVEQMDAQGIRRQAWTREHEFARSLVSDRYPRGRKWRFDIAFEAQMIAVEIDGGVFAKGGGRHTTGKGFTSDCQKLNAATLLGWQVLRGTSPMVESHELVESLVRLLRATLAQETPPTAAPDKGMARPEQEPSGV